MGNVLSCQGPVVQQLIATKETRSGNETAGSMKDDLVKLLKDKCKYVAKQNEISSVQIRGKENNKHLRVEVLNRGLKVDLLRSARTLRPEGLYLNDYLTPARSKLFFELRKLKRETTKIKSVFPWKGVIKCKLFNDKFVQISSDKDLEALRVKINSVDISNS